MEPLRKKLIVPFLIFLVMLSVNTSSFFRGIAEHQTWRIILASVSSLLMIAFAIVIWVNIYRQKKDLTNN